MCIIRKVDPIHKNVVPARASICVETVGTIRPNDSFIFIYITSDVCLCCVFYLLFYLTFISPENRLNEIKHFSQPRSVK